MNDWVADYPLGTVIAGQTTDLETNVLINEPQLGRTYTFPVSSTVANSLGLKDRDTGQRVEARLVRNTTGSAVLPNTVVQVDFTGGADGLANASAAGDAGDRYCYVADPDMPAAGCPDDDIFYVIVKGPTTVLPVAAQDTVAGAAVIAGAGGLADEGTYGTTGDHLVMGSFLATTTYASATPVAMDMNPNWG